ncbi:MAG: hypothetical protein ACC662_06820, partial [Planctomycetota bacterium]
IRIACFASGRADPGVRRRSLEALVALLGPDRVGRAADHPLARGRLALWVRLNARTLRLEDGVFVPRGP